MNNIIIQYQAADTGLWHTIDRIEREQDIQHTTWFYGLLPHEYEGPKRETQEQFRRRAHNKLLNHINNHKILRLTQGWHIHGCSTEEYPPEDLNSWHAGPTLWQDGKWK